MSDNLHDLFDGMKQPPVNDLAKKRAKRAAMAAFKEQKQKKTDSFQGNETTARPMDTSEERRRDDMTVSTKKMWFGGLAACCVLGVGIAMFVPSPELVDPLPREEIDSTSVVNAGGERKVEISQELAVVEEAIAPGSESPAYMDLSESRPAKSKLLAKSENSVNQVAVSSAPMARSLPGAASKEFRRESMPIAPPAESDRDRFKDVEENRVKLVAQEPVSTFSIDVDTVSYSFVRRQLNRGAMPQESAIRVEELINYFDYAYPLPETKAQPFEPSVVVSESPWAKGNKLVHIGIKGFDVAPGEQPDSNLVFLLDVSGSMNGPDRLPLVKQSMGLLLDTLKPTDTVAIAVYAGAAGAVLEPTPVKEKAKILAALNRLNAGGSTAGGAGLELAYQLAEQNFKKNAVNRIILATDGDFNVGVTEDERLEDFVQRKREAGVYLSVLGFGEGNYQDALMQTLAQNGNGIAAYIDTLSEAQKVLVNEATSSLFPIANDVKIQVEFNPKTVKEYRLIGYETRALKREDFNNDKVDSGDIGAGHTVTAIYEITPVGSESALVDDLRYGKSVNPVKKERIINETAEYGFLKMRYKLPGEKQSKLLSKAIVVDSAETHSAELKSSVDFATAVAAFGQMLKGSSFIQSFSYDEIIKLAQANKGEDEFGYRTEFIQLVRKAKIAK